MSRTLGVGITLWLIWDAYLSARFMRRLIRDVKRARRRWERVRSGQAKAVMVTWTRRAV